ncbi:MAG: TetR/AcrR family transcriptional regulator [Phycisphaerae bacterium]|nr:TetR/AcrR family transcriptional regulator [Phycisphaerae bacterium]
MTMEKISTKQKIIAAAKNLFSTHGYSETTIDDIITASGLTKGAFYHYFKSKQLVCIEIIDIVQAEYQNIFESLPSELNPLEKLRTLIKQILELNASGQWVNCKLMLRLSCQMPTLENSVKQKLDGFWKWYIESYLTLIKQSRELKLISENLSVRQQTGLVINMLTGNILTTTISDSGTDAEVIDYILERL